MSLPVLIFLAAGSVMAGAHPDPLDPASLAVLGTNVDSLLTVAGAAYNRGDWQEAASLYLDALQYDVGDAGAIYNLACCYGLMGRDTLAATCLQQSVDAGFGDMGWASGDPDFEPVRSSPYFAAVFDSIAARLAERESEAGIVSFVTTGVMVPCRIHAPAGMDRQSPVDLVIGLHGYGGNADDFARLWGRFRDPDFVFVVPEAPYALPGGGQGFSWSTGSATDPLAAPASWQLSSALVRSTIEQMRSRFDVRRVFLLGFSQGCSLAYTAGLANGDLVDGMICFAGFLDASTLPAGALDRPDRPRVFIAHGTRDRVVDPESSEAARDTLSALGFDVTFRSFDGGHQVPESLLIEAQEWMKD